MSRKRGIVYIIKLITTKGEVCLETSTRSLARSVQLLAAENSLLCEVLVEQKPREVKFRAPKPEGSA